MDSYFSSTFSEMHRFLLFAVFDGSSAAASVAYESVLATGFRGRYTGTKEEPSQTPTEENNEPMSPTKLMPESQTELILKSRKVYPEKLLMADFRFTYEDMESCLENLMKHQNSLGDKKSRYADTLEK